MEKELKTLAKKRTIGSGFASMIGMLVLLLMLCLPTVGIITTVLYIWLFIAIIMMIAVLSKVLFINKMHFTYGKIIKVEDSTSEESDVYQNIIVEYIDGNTKKKCQTVVYEHFGDNDEDWTKIQEIFQGNHKKIEKKVPILYQTNKPRKTIVFLEKAE